MNREGRGEDMNTPRTDAEVWVVYSSAGPEFVATYRQGAIEHARDYQPEFMEEWGPVSVQHYFHERLVVELQARVAELEREIAGWQRYRQNIDEALNTGDGSYRP